MSRHRLQVNLFHKAMRGSLATQAEEEDEPWEPARETGRWFVFLNLSLASRDWLLLCSSDERTYLYRRGSVALVRGRQYKWRVGSLNSLFNLPSSTQHVRRPQAGRAESRICYVKSK